MRFYNLFYFTLKLKFSAEKPHISLSVRSYNNEVYYAEIKDMEDLAKFAEFISHPRDSVLYRKVEYIKNSVFADNKIRKSLANGLEVSAQIEITAASYAQKNSNKIDASSKREFDVNNFFRY